MILEIVKKYLRPEEILLITSNVGSGDSSDLDIYCVTSAKSSVHIFKNENSVWTELFIDSLDDLNKKIENMDEIAMNFIHEMDFVYGDRILFNELNDKIGKRIRNYKIPEKRKNLIKYRIKVLLTKYLKPCKNNIETQNRFIINSLSYPLIQLVLEYHKIFPSSPKRWIVQIRDHVPAKEFNDIQRFIDGNADDVLILALCEKYAGCLADIELDKEKNNDLTFLS